MIVFAELSDQAMPVRCYYYCAVSGWGAVSQFL